MRAALRKPSAIPIPALPRDCRPGSRAPGRFPGPPCHPRFPRVDKGGDPLLGGITPVGCHRVAIFLDISFPVREMESIPIQGEERSIRVVGGIISCHLRAEINHEESAVLGSENSWLRDARRALLCSGNIRDCQRECRPSGAVDRKTYRHPKLSFHIAAGRNRNRASAFRTVRTIGHCGPVLHSVIPGTGRPGNSRHTRHSGSHRNWGHRVRIPHRNAGASA